MDGSPFRIATSTVEIARVDPSKYGPRFGPAPSTDAASNASANDFDAKEFHWKFTLKAWLAKSDLSSSAHIWIAKTLRSPESVHGTPSYCSH